MLLSTAALLLLPPVLSAQEPTFDAISAYHAGAALRFQTTRPVDWESVVPEALMAIPIPTTDAATISELRARLDPYGSVEVHTSVPVPDVLSEQYLYFAGPAGISRLTADSARATVRLVFSIAQDRIVDRAIWGEIYGSIPAHLGEGAGGFVLSAERPMEFESEPVELTADDLLLGGTTVKPTLDGGYPGRGTAFWEVAAQYRFTTGDSSAVWVFVQWQPDRELFEIGCEYRYSLFRLDPGGDPPVQVAWTSYGCDV